jgi:UDP-N-acetylmuramate-alanine ligase
VARAARPGDVVILLGAGSIGTVSEKLMRLLEGR